MNVAAEAAQPTGPQIVIHGLLTIATLNEKSGSWSPATGDITRTPNTTHGSDSENIVRKGTSVGASGGDYKGENYETDF